MKWTELQFRLRTYEISPPGGYCVEQRSFKRCEPDITALARMLSEYRKGNGLARSGLPECLQDVDRFQCLRLGNNPTFCISVNSAADVVVALNASSPYVAPPCRGCGAPVSQ